MLPPESRQSLYELLEVEIGATAQQIETAYTRLRGMVAPDSLAVYAMLDDAEVEDLRHQVEQAYRTLGDPIRRVAYDALCQEQMLEQMLHDAPQAAAAPSQTTLRSDRIVARATTESSTPSGQRPGSQQSPSSAGEPLHRPSELAFAPASSPSGPVRANPHQDSPQRGVQTSPPLYNAEGLEVNGALLRRLRDSNGTQLHQVSEITKIGKRYLAALEENDYLNLPPDVYVRGFVLEYARALKLEPRQVAAQSYMTQYILHRTQSRK